METHELLDQWIDRRMAGAGLPAEWPDCAGGRRRLEERRARPSRPILLWAAAAALLAAAFALPSTRVVARQLWDQMVLGRIQVLLMDGDGDGSAASFFSPEIYVRPRPSQVPSFDEASRRAGFEPRLLPPDVLTGMPSFSVTNEGAARLRLRTPAIRYLLNRAGGSPDEVPDSWNEAVLEIRMGPVVVADYGGTVLLQSQPFELMTPAGFDLERFYRVALQALGMQEQDARALGVDLSMGPALLMVMPKEDRDLVREFEAGSGRGVLIDEVYGAGKTVALWSGSDRLYALFGATEEIGGLIVEVARALE
jgi:hypothetical protein